MEAMAGWRGLSQSNAKQSVRTSNAIRYAGDKDAGGVVARLAHARVLGLVAQAAGSTLVDWPDFRRLVGSVDQTAVLSWAETAMAEEKVEDETPDALRLGLPRSRVIRLKGCKRRVLAHAVVRKRQSLMHPSLLFEQTVGLAAGAKEEPPPP